MAFTTALSGVNAAQSDLDVISNNIANSSTTGFKTGRAEFGDVYAQSLLGTTSRPPVRVCHWHHAAVQSGRFGIHRQRIGCRH